MHGGREAEGKKIGLDPAARAYIRVHGVVESGIVTQKLPSSRRIPLHWIASFDEQTPRIISDQILTRLGLLAFAMTSCPLRSYPSTVAKHEPRKRR